MTISSNQGLKKLREIAEIVELGDRIAENLPTEYARQRLKALVDSTIEERLSDVDKSSRLSAIVDESGEPIEKKPKAEIIQEKILSGEFTFNPFGKNE